MGPFKNGAAAAKVPDPIARDVQRQTVPVDGEDDDQQHRRERSRELNDDAPPPPYETSSAASASGNPAAAVITPPASSRPCVGAPGDADGSRSPRSSSSSISREEDETAGLLGDGRGRKGGFAGEGYPLTPRPRASREDDGGYARTGPMSAEAADRWARLRDTPGCCFSDSGGCFFSSRGGCCFSDRGGCCCSDTSGCCFSTDGACCCSGSGGIGGVMAARL